MRHHPRLLVPHALLTLQVVRPRPRHQLLHNGLLQGERSLRSLQLLPLPLSCRSLQVVTRHLITDAPRQTISPLLNLEVGTHRISVRRSHPHNKLHTTHNTTQMSISDNSHRTLPNRERSTVTVSHTHTLSLHSPRLRSSSLSPQQRTLDSSNSNSSQRQL
jgi:hypothetical protein